MNTLTLLLVAMIAQNADTTRPAAVVETPYTIHSGSFELGATLTMPKNTTGPVPVALIVAGSGPTDRNGNSLMGIRPNSYAQLAWRLAERGIATLRYDKRVLPGTKGTLDIATLTLDDFAADARAAADSLAADKRFSKVFLLGHSEGASLVLLAARDNPRVAGVISVEGLGRPLSAVMHEQVGRQVDSATLVRYDTAMAQYLRGETPKDVPQALAILFVPINQHFMQAWATFDPAAAVRAVRQPILIVQGDHDVQATVADAERLHSARPDAQLVVIPFANHVLKRTTETTLAGQMTLYQTPTIPIMAEVPAAIADWITKQR